MFRLYVEFADGFKDHAVVANLAAVAWLVSRLDGLVSFVVEAV